MRVDLAIGIEDREWLLDAPPWRDRLGDVVLDAPRDDRASGNEGGAFVSVIDENVKAGLCFYYGPGVYLWVDAGPLRCGVGLVKACQRGDRRTCGGRPSIRLVCFSETANVVVSILSLLRETPSLSLSFLVSLLTYIYIQAGKHQ